VIPVFAVTLVWLLCETMVGAVHGEVAGLVVLQAPPAAWLLRLAQALARCIAPDHLVVDRRSLWLIFALALSVAAAAGFRRQRLASFGCWWLMLALLPYVAITAVGDQRGGVPIELRETGIVEHRYYYAAAAAWSLLLVGLVCWSMDESRRLPRRLSRLTTAALAIVGVALLVWQVAAGAKALVAARRAWQRAGLVAERTVANLLTEVDGGAGSLCVRGIPDESGGRYVFRNGITEALRLRSGREDVHVFRTAVGHHCDAILVMDPLTGNLWPSEGSN